MRTSILRFAAITSLTSLFVVSAGCDNANGTSDPPDAGPTQDAAPPPVSHGDFKLAASPTSVRLVAGRSATVMVEISRIQYPGDVIVQVNGLPPGVTADAPGSVGPLALSAIVTLHAGISAPAATDVPVHIGGIGEPGSGLVKAVDVAVTVVPQLGALDVSFAAGGRSVITMTGTEEETRCMRVLPDGKLLIAGTRDAKGTNPDWFAARFGADGSIDTTFGKAGVAAIDFAGRADRLAGCEVLPTGKILLGGTATLLKGLSAPVTDQEFALARLDANGVLDTTFGQTGTLTVDMGTRFDEVGAMAVSGGRVVLAGRTDADPAATNKQFVAVASLTTDAGIDAAFGTNGQVGLTWASERMFATSVAIDAAGNTFVGGFAQTGTDSHMAVSKLLPSGQDAGYGAAGKATIDFGSFEDVPHSLAVLGDGSVLVAGEAGLASGNAELGLARLTPAGALDATFGTGGRVRSLAKAGTKTVASAMRVIDGQAYVAASRTYVLGFSCNGATEQGALTRFDAKTGALDPLLVETDASFDGLGGSATYQDLAVVGDKVYIGGAFAGPGGGPHDAVVARLLVPKM